MSQIQLKLKHTQLTTIFELSGMKLICHSSIKNYSPNDFDHGTNRGLRNKI